MRPELRFKYGEVVVTEGGLLGLVCGHSRFSAIIVPIVRTALLRRRSDVPTDGKIIWSDIEASIAGIVRAHIAYTWPESLLRVVGEADDALSAAVLKAQIRELEADDEPPSAVAWEAREPVREAMAHVSR